MDDVLKKIISRLEFHTGMTVLPVPLDSEKARYDLNFITPRGNMTIFTLKVSLDSKLKWYNAGSAGAKHGTFRFLSEIVEGT